MLAKTASKMSLRRSTRVLPATVANGGNTVAMAKNKRSADAATEQAAPKKSKNSKATTEKITNGDSKKFKVPDTPVTPLRKRRAAAASTATKVPPLTPTPSLVNIIRAPSRPGGVADTDAPADRPVDPHVTSATLVTPGGTQQVAYQDGFPHSSPSKPGLPRPTATTSTLLDQACAHLIKVDPRMKPIIEQHPCEIFSAKGLAEEIDPFRSLASGIMGQQVSGAAARSIKNKFIALFNEANPELAVFPTPAQVVATEIPRLRLAGLSERKAEYIKGLAEKFTSGELTTKMLMTSSDDEVMEKLIAVRGLGDLGVQRGMAAFYGRDVQKLKAKGGGKWKYMSEQDMLDKSAPFAPYRSLYMWYMWRVEDVDVSVMSK